MKDWRNKIILSGDLIRAKSFIGPAQSQMEVLKSELGLRRLSQGVRRVWLQDDVFVECTVCFEQLICRIWSKPVIAIASDEVPTEVNYLLVVTGNETRKLTLTGVIGIFEVGEAVECGDDGYGTIDIVPTLWTKDQTLYGSFVHCYEGILKGLNSLASGTIDECFRRHYADQYTQRELNEAAIGIEVSQYNVFSALDNSPTSDLACDNLDIIIRREWTKVYDDFTLGVFTYIDLSKPLATEKWGAVASYQGQEITWNGLTWFGPFEREVMRNLGDFLTGKGVETHIGWDIWIEEDIDEQRTYFCSLIGDQEETLHVFKLVDFDLQEVNIYSSIFRMFRYNEVESEIPDWHFKYIRLFGYGYNQTTKNHEVYWGSRSRGNPIYYKEIINTGEIIAYDLTDSLSILSGEVTNALWNPIKRELYVITDSGEGPGTLGVAGELTAVFQRISVAHPAAGYGCNWDTSGALITDDPFNPNSWSCENRDSFSLNNCTIFASHSGIDYSYNAFCANKPGDISTSYFFSTKWRCFLKIPDVITYLGKLTIGANNHLKGNRVHYNVYHGAAGFDDTFQHTNCCDQHSGGIEANFTSSSSECRPYSARRYKDQEWIFANDLMGHAYKMLQDNQTQEDSGNNIICVWEDDWQVVQGGNTSILKAASDWPHDYGWTSILLSGTDRAGEDWSGSVIYKDLDGDEGFFVVDQNMKHYPIGSYDRCFFTLQKEEEVING